VLTSTRRSAERLQVQTGGLQNQHHKVTNMLMLHVGQEHGHRANLYTTDQLWMSLHMQGGNGSRGISGKDLYLVTVMSVFMLLWGNLWLILPRPTSIHLRLCITPWLLCTAWGVPLTPFQALMPWHGPLPSSQPAHSSAQLITFAHGSCLVSYF